MQRNTTTLMVVLLVVGLGIGAGVGYYAAPTKQEVTEKEVTVEVNPLEGKTIRIGATVAGQDELEFASPLFDTVIINDVNEYADKLGYDVKFEFLLEQGEYSASVGLEKVQAFKAMGVNLMIGHQWSSQCEASLSYANENDFLLFSHCSTSPILAYPNDNLYRLCPNDLAMAPSMAASLWSYGIEAIIVFQVGDTWGDGIWNVFEPIWEDLGGVVLERTRYAVESTEFSPYIELLNSALGEGIEEYGVEHCAVQTIALGELPTLLTQASDYENMNKVRWFGTEGAGRDTRVLQQCPEVGLQFGCWSPLAAPAYSPMWDYLQDEMLDLTNMYLDFYSGCQYDASWILMQSVLQTGSTEAHDIISILPDVSNHYFGVTGWCKLDENGDRAPPNYDIWGYIRNPDGTVGFDRMGVWSPITNEVTWNLKYVTPIGH